MNLPPPAETVAMGDGITCLPALVPVPGLGTLASNSFVIEAPQPVVIDTGVPPLACHFMTQLKVVMDPAAVRWIWMTHLDPDHIGGLDLLLEAAPAAQIVTTDIGAAKLAMRGLSRDRIHVLAPDQRLDIGGRDLVALRPPCYDAAETIGLLDQRSRTLFAADTFASLLLDDGANMDLTDLATGMLAWARIDNPWLAEVDRARLNQRLRQLAKLQPSRVLTAHLPPQWHDYAVLSSILLDVQAVMAAESRRECTAALDPVA